MTNWSLTWALLACRSTSAPPRPPAAVPEAVEPIAAEAPETTGWADQGIQRHMQQHFSAATDGVWYIAHDRLETMRIRVGELVHAPHKELPESLVPYAEDLAAAAKVWAASTDIADAASQSANTASRCAACHTASGAIPPLTEADVSLDALTPTDVHSLAPYMMWVGLVVPSDRAWTNGAAHLAGEGDPALAMPNGTAYATLAERARAATEADRSAVWVEVVASCAPCHAARDAAVE